MELTVSLETVCRLIIRAREMEAQVPGLAADEDENPLDADDEFAVMEDETNTVVEEEMAAALDDLADDQIAEVLALAWIGRGTYESTEWE
jgi:archaellum component FlaD/FlaE